MSPLMAAIVGFVLGESFTNPAIAEIAVSETEGIVYFRKAGQSASTDCKALKTFARTGIGCWTLPDWNPMSAVRPYDCSSRRLKKCAARNCESIDMDSNAARMI
jgi:hypothetical protein